VLNHLELFAGIGGFRQAIELLGKDFSIKINCVGFSEIDPYATKTYKANFNTENEVELGDIVKFTSDKKNIEALKDFSILTGGFPCQSFSMMGQQKGFEDKRGDVFYRITDILNIKKPPFVLLENVKNLKTHDNGKTFKEIIRSLNKCGYPYVYFDVFNTSNFNLAQTRNRVFIFASRVELPFPFHFSQTAVINSFSSLNCQCSILRQKNVLDILEKKVETKYYLSERLKPTILSNGSKTFISNSEINQLIARPLTATMVKMHRACQDNYYSDEFLMSENPLKYKTNSFSKQELATHNIRKLTPKEAFNLQGFNEMFYQNAQNAGISNHQLYKQAGNAVSVNTVYAILHYLIVKNKILEII
jgi:DNA (cytosine-5)-methyltransferase 1